MKYIKVIMVTDIEKLLYIDGNYISITRKGLETYVRDALRNAGIDDYQVECAFYHEKQTRLDYMKLQVWFDVDINPDCNNIFDDLLAQDKMKSYSKKINRALDSITGICCVGSEYYFRTSQVGFDLLD